VVQPVTVVTPEAVALGFGLGTARPVIAAAAPTIVVGVLASPAGVVADVVVGLGDGAGAGVGLATGVAVGVAVGAGVAAGATEVEEDPVAAVAGPGTLGYKTAGFGVGAALGRAEGGAVTAALAVVGFVSPLVAAVILARDIEGDTLIWAVAELAAVASARAVAAVMLVIGDDAPLPAGSLAATATVSADGITNGELLSDSLLLPLPPPQALSSAHDAKRLAKVVSWYLLDCCMVCGSVSDLGIRGAVEGGSLIGLSIVSAAHAQA